MTDPFADPAAPSGINYQELKGSLLMFKVTGVEEHIPTAYSRPNEKNPAVRADLTVLDGASAGLVVEDALVFPKVLQGQLRSRVGQLVLGRLGQGAAKPGQSAPWKLEPASAADKEKAADHLRRTTTPAVTGPAEQEPPF
jgi:hypothetical protein